MVDIHYTNSSHKFLCGIVGVVEQLPTIRLTSIGLFLFNKAILGYIYVEHLYVGILSRKFK